jgi:hypothetical protein
MRTRHPDFAGEQSYIERAHDCHERAIADERDVVEGRRNAGADAFAQRKLRDMAVKKLERLEGVDTSRLVVGRLDFQDDSRRTIYVGPVTVRDGDRIAVVDFTRDIARGFYRATDDDPMGVARRRSFDVHGRTLIDISDEVFAALPDEALAPPARTVLDRVAAELEQVREPQMRQIVATIVADQYRMIEADARGIFIVQGGPGTGKTAVALHRAVFLIRRNEDLGKVLVVGPNAAFMAYIAEVLPGLGERDVDQTPIDRLAVTGDVARARGDDPREVAAIKGDARMAEVVRRAIGQRIRAADQDHELVFQGLSGTFEADDANAILERERRVERPYMDGRARFVEAMRTAAEDLMQIRSGRLARMRGLRERGVDRNALRRYLTTDREWANLLERMWPTAAAAGVIHDLLTTEQRLRDAGAGLFGEREIGALVRRGVTGVAVHPWTRSDLPLIDEAHAMLQGPTAGYGYVIVDEAQDLTPMELRMVARRSQSGDMTLVGDIAQATGPSRHANWDDIVAHLPQERGVNRDELTVGYRVPRSIMELANHLLGRIAPELTPTRPVRESPIGPAFQRVALGDLPATVAAAVIELADGERSIGVIVPGSQIVDVRGALAVAGIRAGDISTDQLEKRVTLLTGAEAKGLEFDHVVVVEPMAIVIESSTGWSELYVALTRATQRLVVVHAQDLPAPLPGGVEPEFPTLPDDSAVVVGPTVEDELGVEVDFDLDLHLDLDTALAADVTAEPADADTGALTAAESAEAVPSVDGERLAAVAADETAAAAEPQPAARAHEDGKTPAPEADLTEPPRPSEARRVRAQTTPIRLSGDFSEALVLAKVVHGGARRSGTAIPYLSHLLGTVALVLEDGGTETEAVAALLHDAVEDGPPGILDTIRSRFGPTVATIVFECADPDEGSFRERKLEHIRRLEAGSGSARRVALAEKLDNARALLRDLERYGPDAWKAMDVDQDELLWYMRALVALFARSFPSVLSNELERAVERIELLAGTDAENNLIRLLE